MIIPIHNHHVHPFTNIKKYTTEKRTLTIWFTKKNPLIYEIQNFPLNYLSEGTFAYQGINFVTIHPLFSVFYNIIIVIIVITIIVNLPLLLMTRIVSLALLVPSLLFCIVNLKWGYTVLIHLKHYWGLGKHISRDKRAISRRLINFYSL